MLFEELNRKKIEEPEERRAEALRRSTKKGRGHGGKKSSVSLKTVHATLTIIGFLGVCAILAGVAYLGYLGYNLYIDG